MTKQKFFLFAKNQVKTRREKINRGPDVNESDEQECIINSEGNSVR